MTAGNGNGRLSWPRAAAGVARGTVASFYQHWGLALFSVAAAFAIWFVIQDVENPRVEASFPADDQPPSIDVRAANVEDAAPNQTYTVRVRVEGREDDLSSLSNEDFEATIDVSGVAVGSPTEVPVRVRALRDGVRVLSVSPPTVNVTLEPIEEMKFLVTLNTSGQLVAGLEASADVSPLEVTVRGVRDSLQSVLSVDLDVNLNALREGETVLEGELRARSATGSEVGAVTISPARAKVTYTVAQTFVQRSLPVRPVLTGVLAPGYRLGAIVVEPPILTATGPRNQLDGRTEILTEAVNVSGATSEVRLIKNVEVIDNVSLERRTVTVRVEVKPIECGIANTSCSGIALTVGPGLQNLPTGQFVQGTIFAVVKLSGPLPELIKVTPGQVVATVNLAAPSSTGLYPVTVTLPPALTALGVRAEPVDPISVTLGPTP